METEVFVLMTIFGSVVLIVFITQVARILRLLILKRQEHGLSVKSSCPHCNGDGAPIDTLDFQLKIEKLQKRIHNLEEILQATQ